MDLISLTPAGALFVLAGFTVLFRYPRLLLHLLLVSAVFQAAAVVNVGEFGLPIYYFVALLITVRLGWLVYRNHLRLVVHRVAVPLVVFLGVGNRSFGVSAHRFCGYSRA